MNRRATPPDNWLPCQRMYIRWGKNCSLSSYILPPPRHNPTGTMWTVRRQMHPLAQLPKSKQKFFSYSHPIFSQTDCQTTQTGKTDWPERRAHRRSRKSTRNNRPTCSRCRKPSATPQVIPFCTNNICYHQRFYWS